ncbi:exo-alpha-sialidase [Brachyspira pilosicoli]|uniref:exo-alpha-sialidase n=1 Tax=Brachyspira pilosicoli TaxID=52584 RepID=UPI002543ECA0|nr:exo-alpha-sialidase [Brachyspira pilosicoli]WIH84455.1 exo-alpha-sialidase [Brachyspira pilosicoli]
MSKKIIYLLSLLMALSLVFASCKKNNNLDPTNGGPSDVPDPITPPTDLGGNGLYTKWEDLAKKNAEPVQRTAVWKYDGDYSRNPVIVVLGTDKSQVLVISEKRYKKSGSENDIGVDGDTVVDIQWALSVNSGVSFDTGTAKSGVIDTAGTDPAKAHGAPVVFKVADNKVVVVASAGAAISRTSEPYSQRKGSGRGSRIEYTIGTVNGDSMDWTTWTEIQGIQDAVSTVSSTLSDSQNFEQFGTHSARGFTTSDGKMLLAVVMAVQGVTSDYRESMGYLLVTGELSGSSVKWTVGDKSKARAFPSGGNRFSKHKEARIIGGTAENPQYIVVPNGSSTLQLAVGEGFASDPTYGIAGGDGSVGSVTVENWFGKGQYNPSSISGGTKQNLLMHVANIERNLKIYLMNTDFKTAQGTPYSITTEAKSSSIDVLGDGTIVTAAEEGFADKTINRSFVINFTRYTQYFLTTQTGN